MTSSCNRTSKDKHGDLFSFFLACVQGRGGCTQAIFFLARLKISVDSRNYNLCVESMPETDFGMPGMTQIMARPAFQRIQHAGHVRKFGMPGMPEILLGMNYLLLEPRLLAAWVRRSRNLKLCLQGMRNSVACQFQCKTTLGPPPLLPVSKSLTIGMGKILAC